MTAPRLDLARLRSLCLPASIIDGHEYIEIRQALPALLSIAEAAEAWLERGSTLDTHAALRAALAAVRKEEKGE